MKTLRLFLPALLALAACDPATEADSEIQVLTGALTGSVADPTGTVHTFVGVMATAEDGKRFDRWESRTPASLLPLRSPKVEIDQRRWDTVRAGKDWPRSVEERTALGMSVNVCSATERCDRFSNCDGFDHDGFNNDGVDDTEYPVLATASPHIWSNCETNQDFMPNRCNGKYSGLKDYINAQCSGCDTADFLTFELGSQEKLAVFTQPNYGGYCAIINIWANGQPPGGDYGDVRILNHMEQVHTQFNNNISSVLFSGHWDVNGNVRGAIEAWASQTVDAYAVPAITVMGSGCNVPPGPFTPECPPYYIPTLVGSGIDNDINSFALNRFSNANNQ